MKMQVNKTKYTNGLSGLMITIPVMIIIIVFLSGCAVQSVHQKKAMKFYHDGDYDRAVEYFEKALKKKPGSAVKAFLFKAKLNSYYQHLALARSYRNSAKKDEAVREYKIALGIFPNNKKLLEEVETYLDPGKKRPEPFKSTIKPPVSLDIDSTEKMSLNLRSSPITKIFKVVGKSYGINFIFDKDFRDFVYSIEIEKIGFYEILNQLCMVGNAEHRILDSSSILIYPNTTFKKRTFSLRGVKVYYLSNVKAEDAKKLLMTVFRDQQIQVQEDKTLNSLIIKGTYNTLVEIEKFLNSIDKRKSEIVLDIEILEVTKNLINAIGLSFGDTASALSTISAGVVGDDGAVQTNLNFNDLKNTNFFLTIPSAALSFLESDDKNKAIARPNLRGINGEEIQFMVGERVPVPQTQFQAGAAGGFNNIPVTTYQYQDVGVQVKITPYIHRDNEVTLDVKLTINSISGYEGGFPIFGKREVENVIRLKEGETNIIGGFIKDEVRGGVSGIVGLSKIPVLGKLFGASGKTVKQTDIIFSITPRVIRRLDIREEDEKAIWSDVQTASQTGSQRTERAPRDIGSRRSSNSVIISPAKRRIAVNAVSYFTLRLATSTSLSSLSISGSVSGAKAVIEELKTEFFGSKKVNVLKNTSDGSFDLGYSFPPQGMKSSVVAQLKIKFLEKGEYRIELGTVSAISTDRQSVELTGGSAEIEVY